MKNKVKIKVKEINKLKELLVIKGFSQRSFAKKINISSPYLNQIVTGERLPSAKIAKKITDELGVSFEDIFFIDFVYNSIQKGGECNDESTVRSN